MYRDSSGPPPQRPDIRLFVPDESAQPEPKKRRRKHLPKFMRWTEALRLLDYCAAAVSTATARKRAGCLRDEIMIWVGLYLGLRAAEIIGLDVEHIDFDKQQAFIRGKGDADRYVRIPDKLVPRLVAWIGERRHGVLIDKDGKRIAGRTFRWRLAKVAKGAKIEVRVHPHLLRHTYASHLLETGATVREVQALLGHANLATTSVYLDLDTSRLADAVNRL